MGSIPGMGKSSGGGNDNPLQYCCLENPMDRGAWQATESLRVRRDWWHLAHMSAHTVDTTDGSLLQPFSWGLGSETIILLAPFQYVLIILFPQN